MRMVSSAVEEYIADNQKPPAGPGLVPGDSANLSILTSPIAYLVDLPIDLYTGERQPRLFYQGKWFTSSVEGGTDGFQYYSSGQVWLLVSLGPDLKKDLTADKAKEVLSQLNSQNRSTLLAPYRYDPTNGSISSGDIILDRWWRYD